jgi:hypothetical protein
VWQRITQLVTTRKESGNFCGTKHYLRTYLNTEMKPGQWLITNYEHIAATNRTDVSEGTYV